MSQSEITFVFYRYDPSLAAAVTFVILFGLSAAAHLFQLVRNRTWYFIPFLVGGLFEAIGYVGRVLAAEQAPDFTQNPYIMQSLLLLVAPAFFAASIYMILGRIIRLVDGERFSPVRSTWLTKVFVGGDVLSFFMQGGGGGYMASSKTLESFKTGEDIIIGGLFAQLIFFGLFVLVASLFHRRILRQPTPRSRTVAVPWQRYLFVLYAVSGLILVRSIFRVVEYIQGFDGSLQGTEAWLYGFDATLMFLTMVLLNVFHPSRIISHGREKSGLESPGFAGYELREPDSRHGAVWTAGGSVAASDQALTDLTQSRHVPDGIYPVPHRRTSLNRDQA